MEIDSDNVAEIEKYAFLLGSAIKNEDTEQFFSIYDSILPKDLPDNQLEEIKDQARQVSELPDGEFNNLVLKARTFSLAPAGSRMSCRESSKKWVQPAHGGGVSDEEDDGVASLGFSRLPSGKSDTSSLYSTTKISTRSSESEARRFDDDSGVCNSSKATNSVGSFSEGSDDEIRGGTFDYYPPQVKIRAGCGLNLDYDEAHEVKSDHSSQDVNSPRSDISEGIEMTTFSSGRRANEDTDDDFNFTRDQSYQDDFNTDEESDNEASYRERYYNMGYRPLSKDIPDYQPKFPSNRHWDEDMSTMSGLRGSEVDKGINFSGLSDKASQYSRYGACYPKKASSDKVKIEKNSYKNKKEKDPPFGNGPEQLHKVGSSINQLISDIPSDKVKNMPEGRKLELLQPEENRRKKKKKKTSKDDATTDENGNPIVEKLNLKTSYKQMREPPVSVAGGTQHSFDTTSYGTFPGSIEPYTSTKYSTGRDSLDESAAGKRRRKKKTDKQDVKKAEEIEDYKGDQPIEELISFIGGQNVSNKKNKTKLSPATASKDIPAKTQKSNKKNKDKKQKSPPSSASPVEELEAKGSNSAQSVVLESQGGATNNMGNSSGKSESPVENGDIDGLYLNKETITLLKDNDKKIEVTKQDISSFTDSCTDNNKIVNCKEIYKEKEPTGTNSKRDTVSAITVTENHKKKPEKSTKASKVVEKSEMPISKSEDTMKVDISIANNITVKQKNTKNKKSKPASPTVKVESESAMDICQQPVLAGFPSIVDNNFIFTDLEVPQVPKEDEFQVVGKKKKKVTKELVEPHHNNFLGGRGNNKHLRRNDEKRANIVSHSNSKNASHVSPQTSPMEHDAHMRDLSPSAFPALSSGKGRTSLQEGRRNSTGDVPIPCGLKSQDDSDLESVKSLPATQGSQGLDSALSPRLSYARMAAHLAPSKPSESGDMEEQASLDIPDNEHDPKKAVWKGSPTERRHSIGSSPEAVNKNTGSNTTSAASSIKAGSSEHIIADAALKADATGVGVRPVNPWSKAKDADSVSHKNNVDSVLNTNMISPSETSRNSDAKVLVMASPKQTSISPVKNSDSSSASVSHSQHVSATKATNNINKPTEVVYHETENPNSISSNIRSHSVINSSVHKQETSKLVKTSNGSNGKKQKSVIFLDKRVEETPGNLGISFGFEIDSLEKPNTREQTIVTESEQNIDELEFTSDPNPIQCADNNSPVDKPISEPKLVNSSIDKNFPSPTSSSPSVISNNADVGKQSSKPSLISDANSDPVNKAQIVRMNGVVGNSHTQGHRNNNLNSEIQHSNSVSVKTITPDNNVSSLNTNIIPNETHEDNIPISKFSVPESGLEGEVVYYGECVESLKEVLVPSLTNGPRRYCGLVGFRQETELRSNFNIAEAAGFLTKEWDRTMRLQENEPDSVKVHME